MASISSDEYCCSHLNRRSARAYRNRPLTEGFDLGCIIKKGLSFGSKSVVEYRVLIRSVIAKERTFHRYQKRRIRKNIFFIDVCVNQLDVTSKICVGRGWNLSEDHMA